MNSLAYTTRFQLSARTCRKLIFLLSCLLPISLSAQYYTNSICADITISIFDEVYVDSIAAANLSYPGTADTICYTDAVTPEECSWTDFRGYFDISNWDFHADNYDGRVDSSQAPYVIAIEGAKQSPRSNNPRYVAKLQSISPSAGYISFDWESYGGDFYDIDAFYFTVNDSCVQLTRSSMTSGHFDSWCIEPGDTISLEQTSNGTSNHITTALSNFQFVPKVDKIIDRKWKFVDYHADTSRCIQRISVMRPGLEGFSIPANRDGFSAPVLSCENDLAPNPSDYPYIIGIRDTNYLSQDTLHGYSAIYTDVLVSSCGGNRTINRKWTITDHCSGAMRQHSQIIKQRDATGIELACPSDQSFSITRCDISVRLVEPSAWTDCTEDIDVEINWAYGSGARVYYNVAPGRYEIVYTARDGCGLETTCSTWLDLIYVGTSDPVTCKDGLAFTLPASGNLSVPVGELVNGTTYGCSGNLKFEINGSEYLNLDCTDIGWQNYTIEYYDPANPTDVQNCTIEINVLGATATISCPADAWAYCGADLSNLDIYGVPTTNGIPASSIRYQEDRNLDNCGTGYILRTWTVDATCVTATSCSQKIFVEPNGSSISIQWPSDYSIEECGGTLNVNPTSLPVGFGYPSVNNPGACADITFDYVDVPSNSGNQTCYSISRTWTALNSCDATWMDSHTQILSISDVEKPEINEPADQVFYNNSAQCEGSYVVLAIATVMDCDAEVTVQNNSPYAAKGNADASGTYPLGVTIVTFTATDRCGNQSSESTRIEVISTGDPAFTCIGELEVPLEQDAEGNVNYTLGAYKLITSTTTSCGGDQYTYSYSQNIADSTLILTCGDLGLKGVNVYRYNGETWEVCQAWISVVDYGDKCNTTGSFASISGRITTESGEAVKYANVELSGMDDVNSDDNGLYLVEEIPVGNTYMVQPTKEINISNGISTSDMVMLNRHILGVTEMTSPYQLIAGDLTDNGRISVADLSKMNKVILGVDRTLDRSWKFIRSDYTFVNPTNPFIDDFPDYIQIDLQEDMYNLDFIGVKVGDLNYSANPRRIDGFEENETPLYLDTSIETSDEGKMTVTINPTAGDIIEGMQFTLDYDPQLLSYREATSTFGLHPNLVVNQSESIDGRLGIVFVNYDQAASLEPLELIFHNRSDNQADARLSVSSTLYEIEAIVKGNIRPIELRYHELEETNIEVSVAPNPFSSNIQMTINSDKEQPINVSIRDMSGRLILTKTETLTSGLNTYEFQRMDFENAGVYVIQLSNSTFSRWIKVVMID